SQPMRPMLCRSTLAAGIAGTQEGGRGDSPVSGVASDKSAVRENDGGCRKRFGRFAPSKPACSVRVPRRQCGGNVILLRVGRCRCGCALIPDRETNEMVLRTRSFRYLTRRLAQ